MQKPGVPTRYFEGGGGSEKFWIISKNANPRSGFWVPVCSIMCSILKKKIARAVWTLSPDLIFNYHRIYVWIDGVACDLDEGFLFVCFFKFHPQDRNTVLLLFMIM